MAREIVLDTETTGLDPRTGHRLIEIACVELEDYLPTGRTFQRYCHPDRPIDPDAERVHGISLASLADKPRFHEPQVWEEMVAFIGDADLVAHNAPFDRGFLNAELERVGHAGYGPERWVDTLPLAQKRFPGMYNSLDALCKRFKISLSEREKHGALIDTKLLAAVYLELRGGNARKLDLTAAAATTETTVIIERATYAARPRVLAPRLTEEERAAHADFIQTGLKGKAVWLAFDGDA
jgi:DNA polymerase III subunit epsilon